MEPEQVGLLTKPLACAVLGQLVHGARSTTSVAGALGLSIEKCHYWIQRLLAADLARIAEVQKRAGRPIRLYSSVAEIYYVSPELLPLGMQDRLDRANSATLRKALERYRPDLIHDGPLRVTFTDDGVPNMDRLTAPRRHEDLTKSGGWAVLDTTTSLDLDQKAAREFEAKLHGLIEAYKNTEGSAGSSKYLLRITFVPFAD